MNKYHIINLSKFIIIKIICQFHLVFIKYQLNNLIWLKSYNRLRILENFECFECINVLKIQKNF